jgi:N-acetylmuramoyl-L-alanine amidase
MKLIKSLAPVYALVLTVILISAIIGDRAVAVMSGTTSSGNRHVFVIDAGHGGIDGGATSCTGVLESQINLEIALRLNDLLHLLGYETVMIRTTDRSVYTQGQTIAAQKVSDLKERVRTVNETLNGVLISIHQNMYSDGRFSGAQVFYAGDNESRLLAEKLQTNLVQTLNPGSNRRCKMAAGVYLMEHIQTPGVLIECGFLSNIEEEAKLRSPTYQMQLCAVIAATLSTHFESGK